MNSYDRRTWALAAMLAGLAGFVDAIGFLKLGGFFVSFMSGNSTRLAVAAARASAPAWLALSLVGGFVAGVVVESLLGRFAGSIRRTAVLALVTVLLGLAAGADTLHVEGIAIGAMVLAMGAENTIFERRGEVSIGLTYMTGTLVKLGQHLAATMTGGARLGWLPYLLLWLGLVIGAALGAALYPIFALGGLWIAVAWAGVILAGQAWFDLLPTRLRRSLP